MATTERKAGRRSSRTIGGKFSYGGKGHRLRVDDPQGELVAELVEADYTEIFHSSVGDDEYIIIKVGGRKSVSGMDAVKSRKHVESEEIKRLRDVAETLKRSTQTLASNSLRQKVMDSAISASAVATPRSVLPLTAERYMSEVMVALQARLLSLFSRLADSNLDIPSPERMVGLITAGVPTAGPEDLDPYYADIGPFYDSAGAMLQLGSITKQALASRRSSQSVLAMQTGDGQWLYPAWQFDGNGKVHDAVAPALKALRNMDRWGTGVWFVAEHPDLENRSPRQALREHVDPRLIAELAAHDKALLTA